MCKPVDISRAEDETPAELERIPPQLVLVMPCTSCPEAGKEIVPSHEMQKIRSIQACCLIGFALLIDQQRESDAGFLTKRARVGTVAHSDRCQDGALLAECFLMFTQMRDVLPAEDSAIVTQKNKHRRSA